MSTGGPAFIVLHSMKELFKEVEDFRFEIPPAPRHAIRPPSN